MARSFRTSQVLIFPAARTLQVLFFPGAQSRYPWLQYSSAQTSHLPTHARTCGRLALRRTKNQAAPTRATAATIATMMKIQGILWYLQIGEEAS